MAYSFNGCGTLFYGKRDFRADGTYVTTEWVSVFYFPLIPLRSFRLRYRGPAERKFPFGFGSAESYAVFERRRPNGKQVLSIYAMVVLYISWLCLALQLGSQWFPNGLKDENVGFALLAAAVLVPLAIPLVLRRRARKKTGLRKRAARGNVYRLTRRCSEPLAAPRSSL